MVSRNVIQEFVRQVVDQFQPVRVILFGSYAYGKPTRDSDVDIMLIMPYRGSSAKAATRVRLACPRTFAMDLIVRSPAEVRRRLKQGDSFLHEVTSRGVVLHESHDTRMGG
jgi:predicted nucleotidyltransferase